MVGAKTFPANQYVKYGCFFWASQTFHIFFMGWNLTDLNENFQNSNLSFLDLTQISWCLAPLLLNHQQGTHLIAMASRESKFDFQILTYFSSSVCCIKTFGLISTKFTLNIFTKIYQNWMSASSSILCLKRLLLSKELLIKVHDNRHFSADVFFITAKPIAMIFYEIKKTCQYQGFEHFTWICQISPHEINDDVQTSFQNN